MHIEILDRCVPWEKFQAVIWRILVFLAIGACLSAPQPFVPSLQLSWSAISGVGRVVAKELTPGPLSRIQDLHEGKKIFNATPALRTDQVRQQVQPDPRQRALIVSCVGLCVLHCNLLFGGKGVRTHELACPF